MELLVELLGNIQHNLLKPLLLFFLLGFLVPVLKIPFEFPKPLYQSITLYLLISIGWHGGVELAHLSGSGLSDAVGFMVVGFLTNLCVGLVAFWLLRRVTSLRAIDAAVVAGYYGSDSAGTFATALGVITAANIAYAAYMPAILAVMEVPGCLVALFLVTRMRQRGMDVDGNMPGEEGYNADRVLSGEVRSFFDPAVLREVFFNPGLFLLFGGILIGFVSTSAGANTADEDLFFIRIFHAVLCLFLLEMGMTAASRLPDLRSAGAPFIAFGLGMPTVFAVFGIGVLHVWSHLSGAPVALGTYMLFSVLTGSASYIAVPAIQRLAMPESSPTLPLAASLGLTFTWNVTVGIPLYQLIAEQLLKLDPVAPGSGLVALLF